MHPDPGCFWAAAEDEDEDDDDPQSFVSVCACVCVSGAPCSLRVCARALSFSNAVDPQHGIMTMITMMTWMVFRLLLEDVSVCVCVCVCVFLSVICL